MAMVASVQSVVDEQGLEVDVDVSFGVMAQFVTQQA